jgi:hypothetical protein
MVVCPLAESSAAVGSSARMAEGSATMARAIATRCCSPPLSWRGNDAALDVKPTLASTSSVFAIALGPALAAHVKRQPNIFDDRQGGKQVIGLEHEADMLPPDLGKLLWTRPAGGGAANSYSPAGRREHAAKNRQEGGLAAAGWSHQHGQFAAVKGQTDVLQRLHPCWPAAKNLADIRSLDDGLGHRVSTIAGSTRTTRRIAAIAETTHMTTVRRNNSIIKLGRDHNLQCAFRGEMDDGGSDQRRNGKSDHGIEQRLTDNDFVNIAVGGAYRAQRGELIKMVFGAGIECLCDDCSADNKSLSSAPAKSAAPAPVPKSQNDRL